MKCPYCGREYKVAAKNGKEEYAPGVKMSPEEYQRLCDDFGQSVIDSKIEDLSLYLGDKVGMNKYKDHNKTIRRWLKREGIEKRKTGADARVCPNCGRDVSGTNLMTCPRCGFDFATGRM